MKDEIEPDDYDLFASQHRECARLSTTPDLVRFHDDLAERFEGLAADRRMTMPPASS